MILGQVISKIFFFVPISVYCGLEISEYIALKFLPTMILCYDCLWNQFGIELSNFGQYALNTVLSEYYTVSLGRQRTRLELAERLLSTNGPKAADRSVQITIKCVQLQQPQSS